MNGNQEPSEDMSAQHVHEMFRSLLEFTHAGAVLFARDRMLFCNEYLAELIGTGSPADTTPEAFFRSIYREDRDQVAGLFEELFTGSKTSCHFEFRLSNEDEPKHCRGYARRIDQGGCGAVQFIVQDITSRIELDRRMRQSETKMIHGDRLTALGTMAAGLAHELNQPLNTIRVITEGLLFARDKGWNIDMDELFDDLTVISRQVSRMSNIITNIRDFARLEYGATLVDVDVNQAVENVFSMLGRQIEAHSIRVRKELARDAGFLRAQQTRLEQILINLLINAREALEECGHEAKEIWLKTELREGHVVIELGDNATGIPESLRDKIFEPFLTTKEAGKGTGLGLSICRSIAAEMGGVVEAFNNEKGGATFVVTLPQTRVGHEHSSGRR